MRIVPSSLTIADYCQGMERGEITVNKDYQRSDRVWPSVARSFLIETVLLNFPIPKLALHQVTDLQSKKTVKAIVDGQQRSRAILDFYQDDLRLSRGLELEEAAGRKYSELEDELQASFLDYALSFDLFVAASVDQVREMFRRMNLFTVPLNPEEQRHAVFQGPFKWFIHRMARKYDDAFPRIGLFSQKQLVRMADTKLLTEISHAFFNGITTTSKPKLDALYREKDKQDAFPEEEELEERLTSAFDELLGWEEIHDTALMKQHVFYSLLLATMHISNTVPSLVEHFAPPATAAERSRPDIVSNLTRLAQALDDPSSAGEFAEFVEASSERTNVADQRATRFVWCCRALVEPAW